MLGIFRVKRHTSEDEILSGHIDALHVETAFLKDLADEAREEARVCLQRAQQYRNAYDESKKGLAVAKQEKTSKLLEQARQGRDFQNDLIKQYTGTIEKEETTLKQDDDLVERDVVEDSVKRDVVEDLQDTIETLGLEDIEEEDRIDEVVDDAVYKLNRDYTPRQLPGQNCKIPNSWVLENSSKYSSATQCMAPCLKKFVNKDGTSKCSHITYNSNTNACVIYSNTNLKNVVVDKCSIDPNVKTVVMPGIACRGCTR